MKRARIGAIILFGMSAAGGGLTACNVGNDPVRTGESVLELGQLGSGDPFGGSPDAVYLQYWMGSPFEHWGYRGASLVSNARYTPGTLTGVTTTQTPFDLAAVPLTPNQRSFVRYSSVHAYWYRGGEAERQRDLATQHEVLLFARDPEEHFQELAQIRDRFVTQPPPLPTLLVPLTEGFRDAFQPSRLPDAASLVYPPQPNWNTRPPFVSNPGPVPVLASYTSADFWRNGVTPQGPGAAPFDPDGPGSIKAIHVINHGLCAKQVPYDDRLEPNGEVTQGLLKQVGPAFFAALEKNAAEKQKNHATTVELVQSNVASFLHATTDREDAQHGGFFFNFQVRVTNFIAVAGLDLGIADALMGHAYEFKLLDGRLTVEPYRDVAAVGATILGSNLFDLPAAGIKAEFEDVLTQSLLVPLSPGSSAGDLPSVVFQEADKVQEWPGLTAGDGLGCDPRAPGDETIPVSAVPDDVNAPCGAFFKSISAALDTATKGLAGQRLGIPPNAFEQLWNSTALATMRNPHNPGNPNDQVYKNFRCVQRDSKVSPGTTKNVCRYVVPARRLSVLPDAVELVLVDDDHEYTNPSFIPYLIALQANQTGGLCDPPRTQAPGSLDRRPFVNIRYDNKSYSVTNCQQVTFNPDTFSCTVVVQ